MDLGKVKNLFFDLPIFWFFEPGVGNWEKTHLLKDPLTVPLLRSKNQTYLLDLFGVQKVVQLGWKRVLKRRGFLNLLIQGIIRVEYVHQLEDLMHRGSQGFRSTCSVRKHIESKRGIVWSMNWDGVSFLWFHFKLSCFPSVPVKSYLREHFPRHTIIGDDLHFRSKLTLLEKFQYCLPFDRDVI